MKKIRILIIDDNRALRDGLSLALNNTRDMQVVAIGSGVNIIKRAKMENPDVVLLDADLVEDEEFSIIVSVRKLLPDTKVIGMGFVPARSDVISFIEAGAHGFILKEASIEDMVSTIRTVVSGENVLPQVMAEPLFFHIAELSLTKRKGNAKSLVVMTKREREIILLISDGMSNKEIAAELNISTYTVKSHVHNILEKLALHSRLQIALYSSKQ